MSARFVSTPDSGEPLLVTDAAGFAAAAQLLAEATGPIALDAERASTFRYGERAFLIQAKRRDGRIVLIAPEADRDACSRHLAPVLNEATWILHSANNDLGCLRELGFIPAELIDTEIAANLVGEPSFGLGALVEIYAGVELAKNHSHEDWSRTPLPSDWLDYAALDVEYLHEVADGLYRALEEDGKLEWMRQECAHLILTAQQPAPEKTWRDIKGVSSLRTGAARAVAKALDEARQARGQRTDTSVQQLLPNKTLVAAATAQPRTRGAFLRLPLAKRVPRDLVGEWVAVISQALAGPHPPRFAENHPRPPKGERFRDDPHNQEVLDRLRDGLSELAEEHIINRSALVSTDTLRQLIVHARTHGASPDDVADFLAAHGARPWQIELCAPVVARDLAAAL